MNKQKSLFISVTTVLLLLASSHAFAGEHCDQKREQKVSTYEYRLEAKKWILNAHQMAKKIPDIQLKNTVIGVMKSLVEKNGAKNPTGNLCDYPIITKEEIAITIEALTLEPIPLTFSYYQVLDCLERAKEKAGMADHLQIQAFR